MRTKTMRRLLALIMAAMMLLSACTPSKSDSNRGQDKSQNRGQNKSPDALTWCVWGTYARHAAFIELLQETYPDIKIEFEPYNGGNRTGYSWVQMRNDDVPDVFITSQIFDEGLARERLVDLSNYSFVNGLSDKTLDQVEIDGGIYLLPIDYAMHGIYYNKTLMEERGWEVPTDFAQLQALCEEIRAAGLIPGIAGTKLTGGPFSIVFNLAKTDWLTTPTGAKWEQDFLNGDATAKGTWETTMDYVQKYIDIGMLEVDPQDRANNELITYYLGKRKAVFFTAAATSSYTAFENGDELGLMPYLGEDGSKNIYMYAPSCYFGLSKDLTKPGNEKKLEDALKVMSLLYSEEGQEALFGDDSPCRLSILDSSSVPEDSIIHDAQQALRDGRAFPMTYAHWEDVLADMGQAYKEWFWGENDMDGAKCIARMDELQQTHLNNVDDLYFCESTADFTQEETARLVGKALGSTAGADAAMVSLNEFHEGGEENSVGVSGRLFAEKINMEVATTIVPGRDGEYAVMTMTGIEAKDLAATGLDLFGNGNPFPYVLVTRGDQELVDEETYQIAFPTGGYTQETADAYSARIETGSLRAIVQDYLKEQGTVSPDGNPWT